MGLYNFQERFVRHILAGTKKHTIRSLRKKADKPGNKIHCYCGLRRKGARLIGRFTCTKIEQITIELRPYSGPSVLCQGVKFPVVVIDGIVLSTDEKEFLARRDGFSSFHEMMKFWQEPKMRLPFHGHVIHWK